MWPPAALLHPRELTPRWLTAALIAAGLTPSRAVQRFDALDAIPAEALRAAAGSNGSPQRAPL